MAQGVRCAWHVSYCTLRGDGSRPGSAAGNITLLLQWTREVLQTFAVIVYCYCVKSVIQGLLHTLFFRGKKVGMLLVL